ncbi:hypothetical protein STENM223S_00940 [Streptomyces tendae]
MIPNIGKTIGIPMSRVSLSRRLGPVPSPVRAASASVMRCAECKSMIGPHQWVSGAGFRVLSFQLEYPAL